MPVDRATPKPSIGVRRIVVGITGSSGVIYGIRLLEILNEITRKKREDEEEEEKRKIETFVVVSPAASITIKAETDFSINYVEKLATRVFRFSDIAAPIASGSFKFDSMVVIPCSMHTLGAISSGVADNLLVRAAEVALKEKRRLLLIPRETPLSLIHLQNMVRVAEAGAIIVPAMPAFYERPKTLDEVINHLVGKVLDLLDIDYDLFKRWQGISKS